MGEDVSRVELAGTLCCTMVPVRGSLAAYSMETKMSVNPMLCTVRSASSSRCPMTVGIRLDAGEGVG